jgi:hypothetical protein
VRLRQRIEARRDQRQTRARRRRERLRRRRRGGQIGGAQDAHLGSRCEAAERAIDPRLVGVLAHALEPLHHQHLLRAREGDVEDPSLLRQLALAPLVLHQQAQAELLHVETVVVDLGAHQRLLARAEQGQPFAQTAAEPRAQVGHDDDRILEALRGVNRHQHHAALIDGVGLGLALEEVPVGVAVQHARDLRQRQAAPRERAHDLEELAHVLEIAVGARPCREPDEEAGALAAQPHPVGRGHAAGEHPQLDQRGHHLSHLRAPGSSSSGDLSSAAARRRAPERSAPLDGDRVERGVVEPEERRAQETEQRDAVLRTRREAQEVQEIDHLLARVVAVPPLTRYAMPPRRARLELMQRPAIAQQDGDVAGHQRPLADAVGDDRRIGE